MGNLIIKTLTAIVPLLAVSKHIELKHSNKKPSAIGKHF